MSARLNQAGIPTQAAVEAGLVYQPDGGGPLRDRFWDRVIFPVADRAGRTVGFGGRYLPGSRADERGMGKYVNSPEGPLFPKRRLLYGLDRLAAAMREAPAETPILLCEGYLDVMMLAQAGLRCCVAALGTSLTEDHARALRRHDRAVALMLDPDEAGRRAAARAGRLLVAEGIAVRVVELPEGQDPADMVAAGRTEELSERLGSAWDILDWRLDTWVRKADFADPTVRARAAQEAAEWIQSTPNPALGEIWKRRAGDLLGLTEESLRRMVRPAPGFATRQGGAPATDPTAIPSNPALEVLARNEREILNALLHDPSLYPRHMTALDSLELLDPVADQALNWCRHRRQQGLPFDLPQALAEFSDGELRTWFDQVRLQPPPDCARAIDQALRMLPDSRERLLRAEGRLRAHEQSDGPSDERLASLQRRIKIRSADDQD
ncbi:MAG: toprim domain-containing protein [Planctomycetes bacterium]|nr:toprim domain-containing protein [Planctomycetota bacterium]